MAWPMSQDFNEAIQSPAICFEDADLRHGTVVVNKLGLPLPRSGNFADVYAVTSGTRRWAVKCFTRQIPGLRERYAEISKCVISAQLPFMVEFKFLEQGIKVRNQWYPVLKMDWVEGLTLNEFAKNHADKPQDLSTLCQIWVKLAVRLREANLAHCDLQHGNVLLVPGPRASTLSVRLVDYDGMWVPALELLKSIEAGHPNYQHPQRQRDAIWSPHIDRFSHLVILTALRALVVGGRALWDKYDNGDNLLFKQQDFETPNKSPLFAELLRLNDPVVSGLIRHLIDATRRPLDQTPLLETLAGDGQPANRKTGVKGAVGVQVPVAQAVASSAAVFAPATGTATLRRQRTRSPAGAWAVGAAALMAAAAGAVFLATTAGTHEINPEPEVAQDAAIGSRPVTGPTRKPTTAAARPSTPTPMSNQYVTRRLPSTEPKIEHKNEPTPITKTDPPKPKPEPTEAVIDLLPLIDPQKHAIRGTWKLENGALVSDATQAAVIEIPYLPPDEYDFRIVFTRQSGNEGGICQFLSHAECRFTWLMAGWGSKVFGFEQIGGKAADANPTTFRPNSGLENGRQYTALVEVRKDRVAAFLDGRLISQWKTDYKDVSRDCTWTASRGMLLGLGSWQSPTVFHRVELRLVNGVVKPMPVPESEAQAKAEKLIKSLYKDDFDKAKTNSQGMLALADKLLDQARNTKDDPVGRYVLYREALDVTARAPDPATAWKIVGIMAKEYAIDRPEFRTAALEKAAGVASTPASKRTLLEVIDGVTEEAVQDDAFELAEKLLRTADGAIPGITDERLAGMLEARKRQVASLRKEFEMVQKASATLAKSSTDPEANLAVGRYQCLGKGNWDKGLPFLARGSQAKLRDLAKTDLGKPTTPSSQAEVGDGWWDLAESEKEDSPAKIHFQRRALHWYQQALPGLTGLSRTKVEKRHADLEQNPSVKPSSPFLPVPLDKVATAASTRPMFINDPNNTLALPTWGAQEVFKVPFVVTDPKQGKVKNAVVLYGPLGAVSRKMPQTARLSCGSSAQAIHLLGGVSGWGAQGPGPRDGSASLTIRLHYDNGLTEDHRLINGIHLADFGGHFDVPESRLAYKIANKQVRYLTIEPKRLTPIREIEFIKGKDNTAPVVLGVTIERPDWTGRR
jgi:hypothetical protein